MDPEDLMFDGLILTISKLTEVTETNMPWKDTALIPSGETMEIWTSRPKTRTPGGTPKSHWRR